MIKKAAAVLQSIILNHPFIDDSKRTGFLLCEILLSKNHLEIIATEEGNYNFVIQIATNELYF